MIKKILLTLSFLLLLAPVLANQTTTLTIQPSGNVTIDNVQNLYGFDIKIVWNSNELTLINASFNPIWTNYFVALEQSGADFYRLVVVSISGSSFNGSATLIQTQFVGEGSIRFDIVKLSDSYWQPICFTLTSFRVISALEWKALDAWRKQAYSI